MTAEATRLRELWKRGPEDQAAIEGIREKHAGKMAVRALNRIPVDDYIDAVDGDARRAAFMYMTADTLLQKQNAPDVVMDICMSIASDWLAATTMIPCDSQKAYEAKLDAVLHYIATDVDIEIDSDVEEMVSQLRAWRSRPAASKDDQPGANDNPPASAPAADAVAVEDAA